jgi:hypothetical protein
MKMLTLKGMSRSAIKNKQFNSSLVAVRKFKHESK